MGSAIVVALSKLPDELDLATAQRILGDRFDQAVFDRLKDADGYLPKDALLAAVQEKEASLQEGEAAPEVQTEEDEEDDGLTEPQRVAARARAVAEKARDLWMEALERENDPSGGQSTIDGLGVHRGVDGSSYYAGQWKNAKHDGLGVMYFPAKQGGKVGGGVYEGEWRDGLRHGLGVHKSGNGDRYEGEVKDDKRDGWGVFYFADGKVYEGAFAKDKTSGTGLMREPNGATYPM